MSFDLNVVTPDGLVPLEGVSSKTTLQGLRSLIMESSSLSSHFRLYRASPSSSSGGSGLPQPQEVVGDASAECLPLIGAVDRSLIACQRVPSAALIDEAWGAKREETETADDEKAEDEEDTGKWDDEAGDGEEEKYEDDPNHIRITVSGAGGSGSGSGGSEAAHTHSSKTNPQNDNDPDEKTLTMEMPVLSRQTSSSYAVLDSDQLANRQKAVVSSLQDTLELSPADVATMLRFFRFDDTKLLEEWFKDPVAVRAKCGLTKEVVHSTATEHPETFDCLLCSETVPWAKTTALGCDHRFCNDCWANWITASFDKGPAALFTTCPSFKCTVIVPADTFSSFLSEDRQHKVESWLTGMFVQGSRELKWCPAPKCTRAIECKGVRTVRCKCGFEWCFGCSGEDHRPAVCEQVAEWSSKNSQESANVTWIMANTKICPKCRVNIEKNQGCQHMTCQSCKHEFCWLCKGNWSGHSNCNTYQNPEQNEEEKKANAAKNTLERYMFYFTRWDNHSKSIKFAQQTLKLAEKRMRQLQDLNGTGMQEVQFLRDAVSEVIKCRKILQWTYVYGYYLDPKSSQKILFEEHQQRLEQLTEKLHGLSEKPLEELTGEDIRSTMINYTRVISKYRESVLRHTASQEEID